MNARTNRPGGGRLARPLVIAFALAAAAFPGRGEAQTEGNALYRVLLLRAAPGAFEAGMEALRESFTLIEEAGDTAPFWLRHSQGDQWDFMLIVPLGDFAEYYAAERVAARRAVWSSERGRDLARRLEAAFAYREEWLARSIPREAMAVRTGTR